MSDRKSAVYTVILISALSAFYYCETHIWEPRLQEKTRSFQQLAADSVTSIDLENESTEFSKLLKGHISIHDRDQIRDFCTAIRDATEYPPQHPTAIWAIKVHFITTSRKWTANVSSTSNNNGVLIYVHDGKTLRNDELGPMLEKIAAASAAAQ
ncbi:MAG: hypothetical protein U1F71_21585 [Verrucomicrobiaceae bacterium]